jgi:hypothetical protein
VGGGDLRAGAVTPAHPQECLQHPTAIERGSGQEIEHAQHRIRGGKPQQPGDEKARRVEDVGQVGGCAGHPPAARLVSGPAADTASC